LFFIILFLSHFMTLFVHPSSLTTPRPKRQNAIDLSHSVFPSVTAETLESARAILSSFFLDEVMQLSYRHPSFLELKVPLLFSLFDHASVGKGMTPPPSFGCVLVCVQSVFFLCFVFPCQFHTAAVPTRCLPPLVTEGAG